MKRAIHPDDLITWTLPKLVGYGRALEWLYLAEDIDLDAAERAGMINQITSPEDLMPRTLELATRSCSGTNQAYGADQTSRPQRHEPRGV